MEPYQAVILGAVQGLTEFFPVSSSGHLVIFQHLFKLAEPPIMFDVSVHVGTLLAVAVYFYRDIAGMIHAVLRLLTPAGFRSASAGDPDLRLAGLIIVGSVPTALIGFYLNHLAEVLFSSLWIVAVSLFITALLILSTRWAGGRVAEPEKGHFSAFKALIIGTMQGIAVLPGISRSGSTIAAGLFLGLGREQAARYSFLLSIPAILGALALSLFSDTAASPIPLSVTLIGLVTSGLVGYAALSLLVKIVKHGRLYYFAPYCLMLAMVTFFLFAR